MAVFQVSNQRIAIAFVVVSFFLSERLSSCCLAQQQQPLHDNNASSPSVLRRRLDEQEENPFSTVPVAHVIGPTVFPKPTDIRGKNNEPLVPLLKPIQGTHRPAEDAILLFASEYTETNYALFVESLRETGFSGDVVMAIHPSDWKKKPVKDYLQSYENPDDENELHVIVYAPQPDCFTLERDHVFSSKGGSRTCQFHDFYGTTQTDGSVVGVPDPRADRTVANIRYELYWLMTINYHPHSWIMLVDFRDTVFQSNPFVNVPRSSPTDAGGFLFFFGENRDATRIGRSKQNNKWIRTAYGDIIGNALAEKPTICSGATLGEQVALETYLRAMVAEADETLVVLVGSDQGFHNRLYYSAKLANAPTIKSIAVFDQGTGIVNNMGALRTKPLEEWGNGHIVEQNGDDWKVLNWDGTPRYVMRERQVTANITSIVVWKLTVCISLY